MLAHDSTRQRQPQAQASLTAAARLIHAEEAVKNLLLIGITNATAFVAYLQHQTLLDGGRTQQNFAVCRRILHCVIQKDDQEARKRHFIPLHQQIILHVLLQDDALFAGKQCHLCTHPAAQCRHIHLRGIYRQCVLVTACQGHQILRQTAQPVGLACQHPHGFLRKGTEATVIVLLDPLHRQLHDSQGRAHFVRSVSCKLLLLFVHCLHRADIAPGQKVAAVAGQQKKHQRQAQQQKERFIGSLVIKIHVFEHIQNSQLLLALHHGCNCRQVTVAHRALAMHTQKARIVHFLRPVALVAQQCLTRLTLPQLVQNHRFAVRPDKVGKHRLIADAAFRAGGLA